MKKLQNHDLFVRENHECPRRLTCSGQPCTLTKRQDDRVNAIYVSMRRKRGTFPYEYQKKTSYGDAATKIFTSFSLDSSAIL